MIGRSLALAAFAVSFFLILPALTEAQWEWIVDDFSADRQAGTNNLGLWRGGPGNPTISASSVLITDLNGWWCEVIAKDNECVDVSGKALVIHYSVQATGHRIVEFYLKADDCTTLHGTPFSSKVMFHTDGSSIVLPPTLWRHANLTRGHAFLIKGSIEITRIELMDAWDPYQKFMEVADTWYPPVDFAPAPDMTNYRVFVIAESVEFDYPVFEVVLSKLRLPRTSLYNHECVDLTGKIIRISYSNFGDQPHRKNFVFLQYKPFICENSYTAESSVEIMFPSGTQQHVYILASSFRGSKLSNSYKVQVSGPLFVHRITYMDDPAFVIPDPIDLNLPACTRNELLIDDFSLPKQIKRNNRGHYRTGSPDMNPHPDGHVILLHKNDRWTEYIAPWRGSYNMDRKAFRITYSATHTNMLNLSVLQRNGPVCRKRTYCNLLPPPDLRATVLFFAGVKQRVIVSITAFTQSSHAFNTSLVNGITIQGPLTLHKLEVVDNEPPASVQCSSTIASEVLIGIPTVIHDFAHTVSSDIATMCANGELSENATHVMGEIELPSIKDYLTKQLVFDDHPYDPVAGAFRITYSTSTTKPRKLSLTFPPPYQNTKFCKQITFPSGTHKQIVIPFTTWRVHQIFAKLTIFGPHLSIHLVEFVTTIQNGHPDGSLLDDAVPNIVVTRNHLFMDAYKQRSSLYPDHLRDSFGVRFYGEEGIDNGGLSSEFFTLISREMAKKSFGLFTSSPESNYRLQIDPNSGTHDNCTSVFRFIGNIMALAFTRAHVLEIDFSASIFKLIFNEKVGLADLKELEPAIYKSVEKMRQDESVEVAGLTMSAEYPLKNKLVSVEFEESGSDIPVTIHNLDAYLEHYCQWRIHTLVETQISALRKGIMDIMPIYHLKNKGSDFFARQISGVAEINVNEWKLYTKLDGYSVTDWTVVLFWTCMMEWTNAERGELLQFVTGSSRLPYGGFAALGGLRFTIFNAHDVRRIPSSHTCSNQLDLPPYASMGELQAKLRLAMRESAFSTI